MATQLQIRRGTNTQNAAFTGAEGELSANTTNDSVHVHDGSTAGGFELARADFGNISTSATLTIATLNTTNLDLTNLEVTNIKAKDGTAAGSIADSTGVVTIASAVLTTADINGGTIDGATIGGSTAVAGSFTTLQASTSLNVDGSVTADGLTVDGAATIRTQTNANAAFQNSTSVSGGVKINAFNDAGNASVPFELDGSSLQFNISAVEAMRIGSSGVGIGTGANVDELLHIEKSAGTTLVKAEVAANSVVGFEIKKTNATTSNWRIVDGQTVNGKLEIYDVTNSRGVMTFDQSGNVGIGTSSATSPLTVTKDAGGVATFTGISAGGVSSLLMKQSRGSIASPSNSATAGDGNYMLSQVYNSGYATIGSIGIITGSALNNGEIQFNTAISGTVAERMRLSGGDLLVSKTSTNVGIAGVAISASQGVRSTVDGNVPLLLNRLTSDGNMIDLRKSGTTVGVIGVQSGQIEIDGNPGSVTTVRFGTTATIYPNTDAVGDLGAGTRRFKDCYLAGDVILSTNGKGINFAGPTGQAGATSQTLDSYEVGTWSLTDQSGAGMSLTVYVSSYTKIGNQVFFELGMVFPTTTSTAAIRLSLPFTAVSSADNTGGGVITVTNSGRDDSVVVLRNTAIFGLATNLNADVTNASYSGKQLRIAGQYTAA